MCGIAGAFDRTGNRRFPQERLSAMLNAISHRGPDEQGFHAERQLALGARRLSIVDISGGHQPMCNEDGSVWVAFNGELFDYPELRIDLLKRAHRLRTRCDTEAWVHLYEDDDMAMLERTRGQFAVSLWDSRRRRLVLARDRFGICPLYYAESDGWLLWASEARALFASGLITPRPDPKGIDYFFNFFSQPPERTCFDGVRMLRPGHILEAAGGRLNLRRYFDLEFPPSGEERRERGLSDELSGLLDRAVERRLRGDVPVACYISGGLDSTVVLSIASRQRRGAVQSFSMGLMNGAGPNETGPASETAELLGSPLAVASMDSSAIAGAFPELIQAVEAPVLDTSCACMMRLAALAHEHRFKVVLTGEGADEALAGYPWFKAQKLSDLAPPAISDWFGRTLLRAAGSAVSAPPDGVRTAQQKMFDVAGVARSHFYSRGMWDLLGGYRARDDMGIDWERVRRWHPLNRSLYVGYTATLAGMQLFSKGDRVTMHSSIEARYPYLDEDVVQFCAGIAPEYKLRGLTEKWILRDVAARTLPRKIARRPKTMFRAKLAPTFLGKDRPAWIDQLLSAESLRAVGWFDPAGVARAAKRDFRPRRAILDFGLTSVIAAQLWHHIWCGGGLCDLAVWSPPAVPASLAP